MYEVYEVAIHVMEMSTPKGPFSIDTQHPLQA